MWTARLWLPCYEFVRSRKNAYSKYMASTRNNNMPAEYCLQQAGINSQRMHRSFLNSPAGRAYDPAMPLIGTLPTWLPATLLSQNPVTIESQLFGIGANNLVCPQEKERARLSTLPVKSFFKLPKKVEEEQCPDYGHQRPFPLPL